MDCSTALLCLDNAVISLRGYKDCNFIQNLLTSLITSLQINIKHVNVTQLKPSSIYQTISTFLFSTLDFNPNPGTNHQDSDIKHISVIG